MAPTESSASARAAATAAWQSDATQRTARASVRSTSRPATGASNTAGAHSATNSAATARPESVVSWR